MAPRTRRSVPRPLLAACALFFCAAYFAARFPDVPGAGIGSFVSTFLIAMPSFVALWRFLGPKDALVSLLALSAFGYAIETTGVVTGFPYGPFYYGDSLGPKVAGLVPYLLPLSWAPLVLGAVVATAPPASSWRSPPRVLHVLSAAVLLALVDGVLDPGAASLGFWVWPEGGAYYGVPLTNYLGWLLSSALAAALLLALGRRRWGRVAPPPGMLDSLLIAVAFWVGVAVSFGLLVPALLGAGLFLYLLRCRGWLVAAGAARYKSGGRGGE
jgi:putative membrane protein